MVVIREPQTIYFDSDQPKIVDQCLKRKIEFTIKHNESSAENKIKNKIELLLSKYKHENNTCEHGKQQDE